jgi:hypothetical protein
MAKAKTDTVQHERAHAPDPCSRRIPEKVLPPAHAGDAIRPSLHTRAPEAPDPPHPPFSGPNDGPLRSDEIRSLISFAARRETGLQGHPGQKRAQVNSMSFCGQAVFYSNYMILLNYFAAHHSSLTTL